MTPLGRFFPAILAAATDVGTGIFVSQRQPYPVEFLIYQLAMLGFALLLAAPYRLFWIIALLLLIGGVFLAGASVGLFYVPTVFVAACVMVWRLAAGSSGSGSKPL